MLQQQLSCTDTDKLLQTCIVKLERIDPFTCDTCHAAYCDEEKLRRHLATHVKCEDTLVHNTRDPRLASGCARSYKTESEENAMDSVTQQPYISIRDRIMFESDSDDALSDTEISDNFMNWSSDNASVSTNEDELKFDLNTPISNSEALNKNLQGTRLQYHKVKNSKPTSVSGKHVSSPCDMSRKKKKKSTSKLTHQGQVTGGTDDCDKRFYFQTRHEKIQTIKQYSCDICPKSFKTKLSLRQHLKTHSLDKTLKCEICEKKFMLKSQLKVHQRLHNNERPYSCKICNTPFRHSSSLSLHKRNAHANLNDPTNVTEQPTCAICNKRYSQKSGLLRHIYKSHMTIGYPCSMCKKDFGHPVARDWHMDLHKGTFKCSVCGKSYEKKDYLNKCEMSHKKPFECSKCSLKFGRKYHLTRHLKDSCKRLLPNLKEKLFKCQNCNRKFIRKDHLTEHLKLRCKPKLHECARCKIKFSGTLKNHSRECLWKKYECDQCKKKFATKKWMARHIINSICRKK